MEPDREVLLRVEHLTQQFGSVKAVDDVSFSIRRGEVFGLVGESGCGKTTIGRCVVRIYESTAGRIFFGGKQISPGKKRATPQIQMIFQDPMASLNPRMTVQESIAEGLVIGGLKDKAEIRHRVCEMLELVGLRREYAGRYPHEFSGGQRQRIGIARALIMKPQLLIADEPVSALDVSVQAQVINLLNDLRQRLGLTVLFIAHDLSVVKYFSDRIGVMYRGKLVELAEAEALFRQPLHPYTKSLLSAIPLPDPNAERQRVRLRYEENADFSGCTVQEIFPGHFVYCTESEAGKYREKRK